MKTTDFKLVEIKNERILVYNVKITGQILVSQYFFRCDDNNVWKKSCD